MFTLCLLALAALAAIVYFVLPVVLSVLGWLIQAAFSIGLFVVVVLGAVYLLCWAL